MKRLFFPYLVLAGACAHGPALMVADAELASLGPRELAPVEAARKEEAAAQESLAQRRAGLAAAAREVTIALHAIRREEADVAVAKLRFEAAQETRDADAMLPANARRSRAEQALASAQAELRFREAAQALHEALADEGEAAHVLALAALERAKLGALLAAQAQLTPEHEERRATFDAQVAKAQAALATENAGVARAKAAVQAAEDAWRATTKAPAPAPAAATDVP